MDTAIILTTYNRPGLLKDAVESVIFQTYPDWRLYVMDDGSSPECWAKMYELFGRCFGAIVEQGPAHDGVVLHVESGRGPKIVIWRGRERSAEERKATISYSRSINIALSHLLREEEFIAYLCDDDYYYPESIQVRREFLKQNLQASICYGRSRSVQFDREGFNRWSAAAVPTPGRFYPRPTGHWQPPTQGSGGKRWFAPGDAMGEDPETHLPYVEEAYWEPGQLLYGMPHMTDHNQVMHRRAILNPNYFAAYPWTETADPCGDDHRSEVRTEYWGEDMKWGVGDYAFFTELAKRGYPFYAVDGWVVTKRYHSFSDGVQRGATRE